MKFDQNSLKFDPEQTLNAILGFIREVVKDANAGGIVLGLSGGVDSALTAALCTRALGRERVLGVLMPTSFTPEEDISDALELGDLLGIRIEEVSIDSVCEAFAQALRVRGDDPAARIPLANIRARIRMTILYFYANANNYLVAGTGDRSETLIGFFTKHGDGAADFFSIRHLYKTQVRELAKCLGIPDKIAFKPSSPQLYPGHKLSDEIPLDYDRMDPVLVGLFDYRLNPNKVSKMTGVPFEIVKHIIARHNRTEHKRRPPPAIKARVSKRASRRASNR